MAESTTSAPPAAPDATVVVPEAIATDNLARPTVAAEHPRTVAERVGALPDAEREALEAAASPGATSGVAQGEKLEVMLPVAPPPPTEQLSDFEVEALAGLSEGDEYDFGGRRALPLAGGGYAAVTKVKLTGVTKKTGARTFEAVA